MNFIRAVKCALYGVQLTLFNVSSFFIRLNLESITNITGMSCYIFPTAFLSVSLHLVSATPVRLSFFPTINVPLMEHKFGFCIILREVC
jgi:hypothetical protein